MNFEQAISRAERLVALATEMDALQYGDFTLTSGSKSTFYFDGRMLTTDGECAEIISDIFIDLLIKRDIHRFGGPAVAAVPLIGAIAMRAHQRDYELKGFFIRSEAKSHGLGKQIEAHLDVGDRVAVWDDTLATGGSLISAIDAVQDADAEVDFTLCILDRNQGANERIASRNIPVFNILTITPEMRVDADRASLHRWFG